VRQTGFLLLVLSYAWVQAQPYVPDQNPEFFYNEALANYQSENYVVAKHLMDQYLAYQSHPEALYLRAMSAVRGGLSSGEHYITSFLADYPLHPLAQKAQYELVKSHFQKGNWKETVRLAGALDYKALGKAEREEAYFMTGYAHLVQNQPEAAEPKLKSASELGGKYAAPASYYLGTIQLQKKEYVEARASFGKSFASSEWKIKSAVFLAEIDLLEKRYADVTGRCEPLLTKEKTPENYALHVFAGEAYYRQGNYRQATRLYSEGIALGAKAPDAETLFKLGHAYYEIKETEKAIDQLKKSGLNETPTGQASAFQLGKIYLEQGQFQNALNAFKIAARSKHDAVIQEDAHFLSAKLHVRLEQYSQAIESLDEFLKNYPSSKYTSEANELLSTAYLNTSNYDLVIAHYEKSAVKNATLRRNYQQVTLIKGKHAFSDGQPQQAITFLTKSTQVNERSDLLQQAHFWLGESYALLDDTENAKRNYLRAREIHTTDPLPDYGLGYLYYNQEDYQTALDYFQSFRSKAGARHQFSPDGNLRIADCQYALKNYDQALKSYDQLKGQKVPQDYVYFQIGLIHQLNGRVQDAANAYYQVTQMTNSAYRSKAQFQSAQTYFENGQFEPAISLFTTFINNFPTSDWVPYAYDRRGLSYFNLNKNLEAKADYLQVLNKHIGHPAAHNALLGIQELQTRGIDIDFDKYFAAYQAANPDDKNIASIEFEQAKNLYFNQQYTQAVQRFEQLLAKDANSPFKEDIVYYLGDSHHRNGNLVKANQYYEQLISMAPSQYLNRVLEKRGRLLLDQKNGAEAVKNYRRLSREGRNNREVHTAREGLMISYFMLQKFDSTLYFSDQIIKADWKPVNAANVATLYAGRAFAGKGQSELALDEFLSVINMTDDQTAAEAKYRIGEMQYSAGQYKQSVETLLQLNKTYASYQFWIGESFLLLADNYIKLNELLQAKATLVSLEKFPDESVRRRAQEKLKAIDNLQKSQVQTQKDTLR
jgi:TolA-binding protein